eukprot:2967968-Pyramimonas_sp.AAC.1
MGSHWEPKTDPMCAGVGRGAPRVPGPPRAPGCAGHPWGLGVQGTPGAPDAPRPPRTPCVPHAPASPGA